MEKSLWLHALALTAAIAAGACDTGDQGDADPCAGAVEQIEACFGNGSADAFAATCTASEAAAVQDRDCMELTATLLDEKADSTFDDAVLEAIREALRQGIETGLRAAVKQVLQALGVPDDAFAAYLLLDQAKTEQEAEAAAKTWARDLEGRPGFDPIVVPYDGGFGVAHAPCVVSLGEALPRFVADVVMSSPDTLEVLGGTVDRTQHSDTEFEMNVHLPLSLLPTDRDDPAHPDCD